MNREKAIHLVEAWLEATIQVGKPLSQFQQALELLATSTPVEEAAEKILASKAVIEGDYCIPCAPRTCPAGVNQCSRHKMLYSLVIGGLLTEEGMNKIVEAHNKRSRQAT